MAGLLSFRRKIRSGYVLSFLLLVLSYVLIFYVQQKLVVEAKSVTQSYSLINEVVALRGELASAESGARGFVLTGDERMLRPYTESVKRIPLMFENMRSLATQSKMQLAKVDTLYVLSQRRLQFLVWALEDFRDSLRVTAEMRSRRSGSINSMDSTRMYIRRLVDSERAIMEERRLKLNELFVSARIISVISLIIILVALIFSLITFNRENKGREIADGRADKYRRDLESNIAELNERNIELKELKELEKFTSTGRLARTIAHEVRNPLTNILLATEQLREIESVNEEAPVLLELINRNAGRINQLVSELLNATRFSHLDFSRVNMNDLLDQAIEQARDRIDLNKVKVVKHYSAAPCEVYADREKIMVAFLNIIVNAIEAMEKGQGVLEFRTRRQGSKCFVELKDNGKGMDEEVQQKLFEPYFTSKQKGNGLGLTNTQNIILNHKGTINVSSRPGQGATFIITLDLYDPEMEQKNVEK